MAQLSLFGNEKSESFDDDFQINWDDKIGVKPGDIYILGLHRLMCGDATKEQDIKSLMRGDKANMIITDPPYNTSHVGGTADKLTIMGDTQTSKEFREFLRKAFNAANIVSKPGSAFYIFHADMESYNFIGACQDIGWQVRQIIIWAKNSATLGRKDYNYQHEPILYGWTPGGSHKWRGPTNATSIMKYDKPIRNELHPTMKPVGLYMKLIENNSDRSDIILDPFASSGTAIMACYHTNRICRTLEIDPDYCEVIIKRFTRATNIKAVKLN